MLEKYLGQMPTKVLDAFPWIWKVPRCQITHQVKLPSTLVVLIQQRSRVDLLMCCYIRGLKIE